MHTSCELAQATSTASPLPLWERDRVRGLAPAGAEESVDRERPRHFDNARQLAHFSCIGDSEVASRCRASPLTLSLSHKGRGDPVRRPCVKAHLCASPNAFAGVTSSLNPVCTTAPTWPPPLRGGGMTWRFSGRRSDTPGCRRGWSWRGFRA